MAALYTGQVPALALLFAIPNGEARSVVTGARLKAAGVKRGVPDLFLPVARPTGAYGLFLELKDPRYATRVRPEQEAWHVALRAQGYACEVVAGWEAAWNTLITYLDRPDLMVPVPPLPQKGRRTPR